MNSIERDAPDSDRAHCRVCRRAVSALPPPPPIEALSHRVRNVGAVEPVRHRTPSFSSLLARPVRWSAPAFPKASFQPRRRGQALAAIGATLLLIGTVAGAWWFTRSKTVALDTVAAAVSPAKAPPASVAMPIGAATLSTPLLSPFATAALIQTSVPAPAKRRKTRTGNSGDAHASVPAPVDAPTSGHDPDLEVKCLAYPDSAACRKPGVRAEVTRDPFVPR